jgi:hypothetical protein
MYSPEEFYEYSSDCACHANVPQTIPPNFSKSCVLDFCEWSNKPTVYLDATSRDKVCEGTFCSAITNIGKSTLGGSSQLELTNKVVQKCGVGKSGSKVNGETYDEDTSVSDSGDDSGDDSDDDSGDKTSKDKKNQQNQPTPPSPPSSTPKNKNMLFAGGSLVLVCCIIIIAAIIFLTKKKNNK